MTTQITFKRYYHGGRFVDYLAKFEANGFRFTATYSKELRRMSLVSSRDGVTYPATAFESLSLAEARDMLGRLYPDAH